jgi:hypothetical protein
MNREAAPSCGEGMTDASRNIGTIGKISGARHNRRDCSDDDATSDPLATLGGQADLAVKRPGN